MSKLKYNTSNLLNKILNLKVLVLLSNLIFQGIPYMTFGEKLYKISITLFFALMFYLMMGDIILSLCFGHVLNYIVNGQFFVVYRYIGKKDTMNFSILKDFLLLIQRQSEIFNPIDILFTGSFSKGTMSRQSDLDIRIYHKAGFVNSVKSYIMASVLRFSGLLMKFPIDVYCFSDLKFLGPNKVHPSEIPVHIRGEEEFLREFPNSCQLDTQVENLVIK